jgi:hypothetical protein
MLKWIIVIVLVLIVAALFMGMVTFPLALSSDIVSSGSSAALLSAGQPAASAALVPADELNKRIFFNLPADVGAPDRHGTGTTAATASKGMLISDFVFEAGQDITNYTGYYNPTRAAIDYPNIVSHLAAAGDVLTGVFPSQMPGADYHRVAVSSKFLRHFTGPVLVHAFEVGKHAAAATATDAMDHPYVILDEGGELANLGSTASPPPTNAPLPLLAASANGKYALRDGFFRLRTAAPVGTDPAVTTAVNVKPYWVDVIRPMAGGPCGAKQVVLCLPRNFKCDGQNVFFLFTPLADPVIPKCEPAPAPRCVPVFPRCPPKVMVGPC